MKKSILLFASILVTLNCYSQTEKGKYMIGGRFGFSGSDISSVDSLNQGDSKNNGFLIYPNVGYFVKDNFAIGINLNLGYSSGEQNNYYNNFPPVRMTTFEYSSVIYGAGIFGRCYKKIVDNFYFAFSGGISYSKEEMEKEFTTSDPNFIPSAYNPAKQETHRNSFSVGFSPLLVYFVTAKLGIEGGFGNIYYHNSKTENISVPSDESNKSNSYGVNLNSSSLFLGLNYYF